MGPAAPGDGLQGEEALWSGSELTAELHDSLSALAGGCPA